jgi:hypothetical protein
MNSVCERFLGSVRRECLNHLIILNEWYLQRVLEEYTLNYFNTLRPHQGIEQRVPVHSARKLYSANANVESLPVLAGLHHEYRVLSETPDVKISQNSQNLFGGGPDRSLGRL